MLNKQPGNGRSAMYLKANERDVGPALAQLRSLLTVVVSGGFAGFWFQLQKLVLCF